MLKEFKAFLMRGNVVDLAVAVVVGAAFGAVVNALVTDLLTPLISIPGKADFASLHFTIHGSTFAVRRLHQRADRVLRDRGCGLLLRRQAVERARGPAPAGGGNDARLPRVPQRHPEGGAPLRVLHRGGGTRRCRLTVAPMRRARARRCGMGSAGRGCDGSVSCVHSTGTTAAWAEGKRLRDVRHVHRAHRSRHDPLLGRPRHLDRAPERFPISADRAAGPGDGRAAAGTSFSGSSSSGRAGRSGPSGTGVA